jgi:Pregnancy-associated plasma protein-A.
MKIKGKQLKYILLLSTIVFLGMSFYVFSQKTNLEQKIADKQTSKGKIDNYLVNYVRSTSDNQQALDLFSITKAKDSKILHSYKTPEGFEMISYTNKWTKEKLIDLYEELMKNRHGDEIELLYQVIVYGVADSYAAGDHSNESKEFELQLRFPALRSNSSITYELEMGTIQLYNGNEYTKVQQFAHTLSHEYGHHFTFHHFFKDGVEGSEYAKLRNVAADMVRYNWWDDQNDYKKNHHWYLVEIAAEDYVQIMGSPMTKNQVDYKDIREILNGAKWVGNLDSKNGTPQENLMIPFAHEVEGLYDYFNKFVSDTYEPAPTLPIEKNIEIKVKKGSSSQLGADGMLYFTHYVISWNDAYKNEKASYTLVCYDENDYYIHPIKTVGYGNSMTAYIGTVSINRNNYIYWQYDNIDKGNKNFVVIVHFPDGTILKSKPFAYSFK